MSSDEVFPMVGTFAAALKKLHRKRRNRVVAGRSERIGRAALTRADRSEVLSKTGGRCHICGCPIEGSDWEADHILAHSTGGSHVVDNYLPAHSIL